jgi:D-glycero-D-manno-heptose 1,7-bisphosphate phosphatase
MNKAVFIDKDGTLIHDVPYNVDPALVQLQEGAAKALHLLKKDGFLLILVSNQSGVAHGLFNEQDLWLVEKRLQTMLGTRAALDAFYFCPHHPAGKIKKYAISCACRKPSPGMLTQAAHDFNIDLSCSWMIGDILNDVEAGNKAGCKTILLDNGNETEWALTPERTPLRVVKDLSEAAALILQKELV